MPASTVATREHRLLVQCVTIVSRSHIIASAPTARLIRVVQSSLATAAREREARELAAACRELDARQCRIRLDAAQREIDRLRRGIDVCDLRQCRPHHCEPSALPPNATAPAAAASCAVPLYALPLPCEETSAAVPMPLLLHRYTFVSPAGTLLDLIA